jgi:hypothetical protein
VIQRKSIGLPTNFIWPSDFKTVILTPEPDGKSCFPLICHGILMILFNDAGSVFIQW